MKLIDAIIDCAQKHSEKNAIICNEKKYSYKQLVQNIMFLSSLFIKNKRNAAIILLPKSELTIFFQLAICASDNIFVPLDFSIPDERFKEILLQLQPRWIISTKNCSQFGFTKTSCTADYSIWETDIEPQNQPQAPTILNTQIALAPPMELKKCDQSNPSIAKGIKHLDENQTEEIQRFKPNYRASTFEQKPKSKIKTKELSSSKIIPINYEKAVSHILFSSGSSGKPKGIKLAQEPVVNVVLQQAKKVNIEHNKICAWLLSPAFDASLSDIYSCLLTGATLHVCTFSQNKIKTLIDYLVKHKITHSDISPALFGLLAPHIHRTSLEAIVFGGELPNENITKTIAKNIKMFNCYGPTEATICTSMRQVDDSWSADNIGTPLDGVQYSISNENELLISGNHLAIGYLDEKLTEKHFILKNNQYYYKTGDLVKKDGDEYFYIGRFDRQFKQNGILIAPEEIEQCAKNTGCISAKLVFDNSTKKSTLYYQQPEHTTIPPEALRHLLEQKLNKNMLPHFLINVPNFNTNTNGKTILNLS